jgi:hypothetical protein
MYFSLSRVSNSAVTAPLADNAAGLTNALFPHPSYNDDILLEHRRRTCFEMLEKVLPMA